jgi:hypothetical protein
MSIDPLRILRRRARRRAKVLAEAQQFRVLFGDDAHSEIQKKLRKPNLASRYRQILDGAERELRRPAPSEGEAWWRAQWRAWMAGDFSLIRSPKRKRRPAGATTMACELERTMKGLGRTIISAPLSLVSRVGIALRGRRPGT